MRPSCTAGLKWGEDVSPCAFIVRTAAMTLVDNDEIEEVPRVISEIWGRVALGILSGHEGLEDSEKHACVLRYAALLSDFLRVDSHQRLILESCK
jgi:hypothetical protein